MLERAICLIILIAISSLVAAERIHKAMREYQIVPDVIDSAPDKLIKVIFLIYVKILISMIPNISTHVVYR